MKLTSAVVALLLMVASAALVFHLFQRQLATASLAFGFHPDVLTQLELSLDDQKRLARVDPARELEYRSRFDALETTVHRLQILDGSRDALLRRYNTIVVALFAGLVVLVSLTYALRQASQGRRLAGIQRALTMLAGGGNDIDLGERRGGTIGRIAAMIEETSRVMARDRRRIAAMQNLTAWQEATRRHAHEMRMPLTALKLELTQLRDGLGPNQEPELARTAHDAMEEVERLGRFAERFTSFARLPQPRLERRDLGEFLRDYLSTYASAWPNLELELEANEPALEADVDREMLRQVLVNLCDNSSHAVGEGQGRVRIALRRGQGGIEIELADNGPGVDESIRSRLFEPYVTTRSVGEGMGLGLAISKKILLDHGGDLEWLDTSGGGAAFRLTLP
jgi:two-component system nitrogen regulation sensor histidine kinase NtrY